MDAETLLLLRTTNPAKHSSSRVIKREVFVRREVLLQCIHKCVNCSRCDMRL